MARKNLQNRGAYLTPDVHPQICLGDRLASFRISLLIRSGQLPRDWHFAHNTEQVPTRRSVCLDCLLVPHPPNKIGEQGQPQEFYLRFHCASWGRTDGIGRCALGIGSKYGPGLVAKKNGLVPKVTNLL